MGNNHSHTVNLAEKIESAIRFKKDQLVLNETGLDDELKKITPHFEKKGYGLHWEERTVATGVTISSEAIPARTLEQLLPSLQDTPEGRRIWDNEKSITNFESSSRVQTVVEIKPLAELEKFERIDWNCALNEK
jgi:hypothetical protein